LCKLLHEFLEIKLQLMFLKDQARVDVVESESSSDDDQADSKTGGGEAGAESHPMVIRKASPRRKSASVFSFRCMPELYKHTIPFVVSDAEWTLELYKADSKFPFGYDSLKFSKGVYDRQAYAFIVSSNPRAQIPETFAMVQTVMEQNNLHLQVRPHAIDFAKVSDVKNAPRFVFALYNDPKRVFDHGYNPDTDDATYYEKGRTHSPLYRICYLGAEERSQNDACVLLVYESVKESTQADEKDSAIVLYHPSDGINHPVVVTDADPIIHKVGDETSAYVSACNVHFFDGKPTVSFNVSLCELEECSALGFHRLSDLVKVGHKKRSIVFSVHDACKNRVFCKDADRVRIECPKSGKNGQDAPVIHVVRSQVTR
jgi:hypothetical protein